MKEHIKCWWLAYTLILCGLALIVGLWSRGIQLDARRAQQYLECKDKTTRFIQRYADGSLIPDYIPAPDYEWCARTILKVDIPIPPRPTNNK